MKILFIIFASLICWSSQAATVLFSLTNWNGTTPTNYVRIVQNPSPTFSSPSVIIGRPIVLRPTNGVAQTNMLAGYYRLEVEGIPNTVPIVFAVPDDSNTYQVTQLITNAAVVSPSIGYTQSAADSKFVIRTNAVFSGSTNAFRFTNGVTAGQFLQTDGTNWFSATVTPGSGLSVAVTSINGDTNSAQKIITSESGTDFAITTSGGTNTVKLPIASASATGKLSSSDYSTFVSKQPGSSNLSNWSAIATTTKQPASDNLTNWSALATSAKQDALGYTPLNVVSNLSDVANAAAARSNIGAGTGNGTVTSVGLTGDSDFEFGAAITTSGTISIAQTNSTGSGKYVRQTSPTLTTPTIGSFVNANHNHQDSAGGGTITEAALNLSDNTTANGTTNRHGLLPKLPNDATKFLDGTGAYSVPPSGSGTVSSVAVTADSDFEITGSPITTTGTINIANTNSTGNGKYVRQTASTLSGATLSGSTTNTGLTASRPMKTDANKVQVSGQIDLSTANEVTGVLLAAGFPALTGDITTSAGALATTLKNTGTAGTYAGITFDAQGRETSAVAYPAAIFVGNFQNLTLSTTGRQLGFGTQAAPQTFSATVERQASVPIFRGGTFSNLVFKVLDHATGNAFLGSGTNTTFILYTNAVASPFAFTLDGTTTTTNSGTSSITIPANATVSWRATNQVTVATDISWSVELY